MKSKADKEFEAKFLVTRKRGQAIVDAMEVFWKTLGHMEPDEILLACRLLPQRHGYYLKKWTLHIKDDHKPVVDRRRARK